MPADGVGAVPALSGQQWNPVVAVADAMFGVVLLVSGVWCLWTVSRKMRLAGWPIIFLGVALTPIGALAHLPSSPVAIRSDGLAYLAWAGEIEGRWKGIEDDGHADAIWPGKGVWPTLVAALRLVLGPVEFTPLVINILVLLSCFLLAQRSAKLLESRVRDSLIAILAITSPPFVVFGPSLLRESFFWLGISFMILAISQLSESSIWKSLISVTVGAAITLAFRPDVGIVLVYLTLFLMIWIAAVTLVFPFWSKIALATVGTGALMSSFRAVFSLMQPKGTANRVAAISQALSKEDVATGFRPRQPEVMDINPNLQPEVMDINPNLQPEVMDINPIFPRCDSDVFLLLLCQAVENAPRTFFGPFSWEYQAEIVWLLAGVSTVHFLVLLALAFVGLFAAPRSTRFVLVGQIVLALASMVVWASTLTNYGILLRFRGTTEVALLPSALVGASYLINRVKSTLTNWSLRYSPSEGTNK